jgi:hypothetical protein
VEEARGQAAAAMGALEDLASQLHHNGVHVGSCVAFGARIRRHLDSLRPPRVPAAPPSPGSRLEKERTVSALHGDHTPEPVRVRLIEPYASPSYRDVAEHLIFMETPLHRYAFTLFEACELRDALTWLLAHAPAPSLVPPSFETITAREPTSSKHECHDDRGERCDPDHCVAVACHHQDVMRPTVTQASMDLSCVCGRTLTLQIVTRGSGGGGGGADVSQDRPIPPLSEIMSDERFGFGPGTSVKIVNTDNFGRDYPNESFFVDVSMPLEVANAIVERLNKSLGHSEASSRYGREPDRIYKVVSPEYVLQPGFEP